MIDSNKGFVEQIEELTKHNEQSAETNKRLLAEKKELNKKIEQLEKELHSITADEHKKRFLIVLISLCAVVVSFVVGGVIFTNISWGQEPEFSPEWTYLAYEPYHEILVDLTDYYYVDDATDATVPDFYQLASELADFFGQFGDTVSVFYENLETGFTFSHYGDRVFFGASTTKSPFALYIYQKAQRGETDLNSTHTFTQGDFWEGSGVIRHNHDIGDVFTQHQLLYFMLAHSDNVAVRMLRRVHGLVGYRYFIESIGANPHFVQSLTHSYISAYDAGIILREFYEYINSGGIYSHQFKENLLANQYPLITSRYPVASKSTQTTNFGGALHDIAVVFAPSPYTLALLSTREGNPTDIQVYNGISQFIQDFNNYWFSETRDQ
ncbi:MAG: serine hydrolase [Defluviitaleaceae bacterium]|nr:serine hydrolase [Defluviitaleaceae bacterium]